MERMLICIKHSFPWCSNLSSCIYLNIIWISNKKNINYRHERSVRNTFKVFLENDGYCAIASEDAEQAYELMKAI